MVNNIVSKELTYLKLQGPSYMVSCRSFIFPPSFHAKNNKYQVLLVALSCKSNTYTPPSLRLAYQIYLQIFRVSLLRLAKVSLCLIVIIFLLCSVAAADGDYLEDRISGQLPGNAEWALEIINMNSAKQIKSIGNAGSSAGLFAPGSLMKLFIAGAVYDRYESSGGFSMFTKVAYDGVDSEATLSGNLYIVGAGNALLSSRDLKFVIKQLKSMGVESLKGDIIVDDTLFDSNGLERKRKGPAYARPGALGLDLHTVAVSVKPARVGGPPVVSIYPQNDAVRFAISATTVQGTSNTLKIMQLSDVAYKITGNIAHGTTGVKRRFALSDPAMYAGGVLKTLLESDGIEIEGKVRKGRMPNSATVLQEINGPSLDALIRDMNIESLNVVADNLLLLFGMEVTGQTGTVQSGLLAVEQFLVSLGLNTDEVKFGDVSGLSVSNRVSARFMAAYLQKISGKAWFEKFYTGLPGTGEGALRNFDISGKNLRVKTGGLEDAFALAGYGANSRGERVVFSYIVNVPGAGLIGLKQSAEEVLKYVSGEVVR